MQEARQVRLSVYNDLAKAVQVDESQSHLRLLNSEVATLLEECSDAQERATRILSLLVQQCHCTGGFLYTIQEQGPALSAHSDSVTPTTEIETMVQEHMLRELEEETGMILSDNGNDTSTIPNAMELESWRADYHSVLLGHSDDRNRNNGSRAHA